MQQQPTFRPMRMNDLPQVLSIEKESFPTPWRSADFLSQSRRNEAKSYVAVQDGSVIAYAVTVLERGAMHLMNFAVEKGRRRRGIGTRLMKCVLDEARSTGCSRAYLEVRERNVAAQLFYQKMQFRAARILKKYYVDTGEDAYVMELPLP